jgi:7,8-dihydropterin-6-yl-methyl-4-(beta-D-ribofuranosyl)aminobenzene 5'-phosphate synthase
MKTEIKEEGMTRRNFIMGLGIGVPALYLSTTLSNFQESGVGIKVDVGECKSIRICCISETSWFDDVQLMKDIVKAGGMSANQYFVQWDPKNSGGYSALIEVEALTGTWRRFLLDAGWNPGWMVYSFMREGIDDMLRKNDIEFLYVSHEHMDHFWGLPVILQYRPNLKVIISKGYSQEGKSIFQEGGHKGELLELGSGRVHKLFPGCASATFDIPLLIGVQGEQNLFFNVKGKGLIIVTACCHVGILNLIKYAQERIHDGDKLYGLYGGLHISPFGEWNPNLNTVITGLQTRQLQKVAANHCTGRIATQRMAAANIPIVKGTAKYGSRNDFYLGNGDEVIF